MPDPGNRRKLKGMTTLVGVALVVDLSFFGANALSQRRQDAGPDGQGRMKKGGFPKKGMGKEALKEPFKGVSTNGQIVRGLFPIKSTGETTQPVKEAPASSRTLAAWPINPSQASPRYPPWCRELAKPRGRRWDGRSARYHPSGAD